ncbi:uncharacterized protein L203_106200 [Cryptococcus depauperatus CBS 7841]|uniref:Uncharacterized protein n=1 Tax=Cryptococcus depauperatus CBS 7841 TaxID=1295531 RepID=A0A1E3IVP7_9TREE|nr:hypothetical protein L203_00911 [Cryptococcus depauperatus CBS 7841]
MTSTKGAYYNGVLTAALLAGSWAENLPAATPNGSALTWGELIRKWGKHTGANTRLVNHLRDISLLYLSRSHSLASSSFLSVPPPHQSAGKGNQQLQSSESSPSASAPTPADSGSQTISSFVHIPHPHLRRHKPEPIDESAESNVTVRPKDASSRAAPLSSAEIDGDDSDEHGAWAEGQSWWTGLAPEFIDEARDGLKALENLCEGNLSFEQLTSARTIQAYYLHSFGSHDAALKILENIEWDGESRSGILNGDAAVLERVRARCLQGLCYELCSNPNYDLALKAYLSTVTLLQSLVAFYFPTPAYLGQVSSSPKAFNACREAYRWLSTALARVSVLSARQQGAGYQMLRTLRTYHAFSSSWPAEFRPKQRQKMLILYLRTLYATPSPSYTDPLLYPVPPVTEVPKHLWRNEVLQVMTEGKDLLTRSTSFPKAGTINYPVIVFSQLCVHLYSLLPTLDSQVLDILWWAMALTFHSQSILRYLVRILIDRRDYLDARRIFELYVRLVLKSRQTAQPEVPLQLQSKPGDESPTYSTTIPRQASKGTGHHQYASSTEKSEKQDASYEADKEADFVLTLLAGVKLLYENLDEAEEAWRYACLASDAVRIGGLEGEEQIDVESKVEEAKGIVRMALAKRVDAHTRPTYQSQSINHLILSITLKPTPSAYYHLAHCYAGARQMPKAVDAIRKSLEMDEKNVEGWHLLSILLTAQGDWEGAGRACDAGVKVWQEREDRLVFEPSSSFTSQTVPNEEGVAVEGSITESLVPMLLPTGVFTSLPPLCPALPPCAARLAQVIRLRMTLNAIVEKTSGCEAAMIKQQELFAFFSERCGRGGSKRGSTTGSKNDDGSLTGSYINIQNETNAAAQNIPVLTTPIPATPLVTSRPSSPLSSSSSASNGGRRRSASLRHFKSKHLILPMRAKSLRGSTTYDDRTGSRIATPAPTKSRTVSISSIAPTAIHSHYRTSRPTPLPPAPISSSIIDTRTSEEKRILSDLWLASAATFRRWGKLDQCLVSIMEAEGLDPGNENVWAQLGLYHVVTDAANGKQRRKFGEDELDKAEAAFIKALLIRADYAPATIGLSKLYLSDSTSTTLSSDAQTGLQGADLAESLLNQLTQSFGWDNSEAWYILGKVAKVQGREERARECWEFALNLEQGRGVRDWDVVKNWL